MIHYVNSIVGAFQHPVEDVAVACEILIAESKYLCGQAIAAVAPTHKQLNAALGLLSAEDAAAIAAHIAACRTQQNSYESAVLGVLEDTELTDAARVTALAALTY